MKKVSVIYPSENRIQNKIRVAAYARVSSGSDEQLKSLTAQKEYYQRYNILSPILNGCL